MPANPAQADPKVQPFLILIVAKGLRPALCQASIPPLQAAPRWVGAIITMPICPREKPGLGGS